MNATAKLWLTKWLLAFLVVVVIGLPQAVLARHAPSSAAGLAGTRITVDPSKLSYPISPDFAGFTVEAANLCRIVALDQQLPAFAQLFSNLGPATMHIGGSTVDRSTWDPNGTSSCFWKQTVLNQTLIDQLFAFALKVNWKVQWTINLKHFDPTQFSNEAAYAVTSGGSSLAAVEFGNEPDRYHIPYSTFKSNWEAYYTAFRALEPATPVTGPSLAGAPWFPKFLKDEGSKVTDATTHFYLGPAGGKHPPTIKQLLSPITVQTEIADISHMYRQAHTYGLPLWVNETNDYYHQGQPGVSDVFASALWAADYMFIAAEQGVLRVNFHGVPNDPNGNSKGKLNYYAPINNDGTPAPDYYGLLLFHYAAPNGSIVQVKLRTPYNVTAHAVLAQDGSLRVIIVNKDQVHTANVTINTTQAYTSASAISLLAPSIDARSGITLGGSPVAPDGTWAPSNIVTVPVNGNLSSVTVPPGSAMVITYS